MEQQRKKLRDVLPQEFFIEFMHSQPRSWKAQDTPSPAARLLDVEVEVEMTRSKLIDGQFVDNPEWEEWPGPQQNVHCWWELVNGKGVGWNESPSHGWSFPVINLNAKPRRKKRF